eukprot:6188967-Pleurochrysis_carterae.AAC.3
MDTPWTCTHGDRGRRSISECRCVVAEADLDRSSITIGSVRVRMCAWRWDMTIISDQYMYGWMWDMPVDDQ